MKAAIFMKIASNESMWGTRFKMGEEENPPEGIMKDKVIIKK